MGDELHSRNTAAALLLLREIAPALIDLAGSHPRPAEISEALAAITADREWAMMALYSDSFGLRRLLPPPTVRVPPRWGSDYFFLRLSMAAAKATADAAHGIEGSSVITAMGFSCHEFGIRVSVLIADSAFC